MGGKADLTVKMKISYDPAVDASEILPDLRQRKIHLENLVAV